MEQEQEQEISTGRKVTGFILAFFGLPMLFAGTCIPVGLGMLQAGNQAFWAFIVIYALVFLGVLVWIAKRSQNPGVRWGVVFWVVSAALIALITFTP